MPRLNSKLTHVVKYLKGNHKMTYIYKYSINELKLDKTCIST